LFIIPPLKFKNLNQRAKMTNPVPSSEYSVNNNNCLTVLGKGAVALVCAGFMCAAAGAMLHSVLLLKVGLGLGGAGFGVGVGISIYAYCTSSKNNKQEQNKSEARGYGDFTYAKKPASKELNQASQHAPWQKSAKKLA